MTVTLDIRCDNAAFEGEDGPGEVARILRKAASSIERMERLEDDGIRLLDSNGNTVGHAVIAE